MPGSEPPRDETQRILVTGASGFLGRNLIDHLASREDVETIAACRHPGSLDLGRTPRARIVALDLTDGHDLRTLLAEIRPSHVVNCAAYGVSPGDRDAPRARAVNVDGALALLEAAAGAGVARFVQIGSCSEYGPASGPIQEETAIAPRGVYARSKAAASLLAGDLAAQAGIDLAIVRLFGLWGPYEASHRLVPSIRADLARGERVPLSAGTQIRDFSYAPQAAEALAAILLDPRPWRSAIVNLGTGTGITVRDFATLVARALGAENRLDFGALQMRPDEPPEQIADISTLRSRGLPIPSCDHARQIERFLDSGP